MREITENTPESLRCGHRHEAVRVTSKGDVSSVQVRSIVRVSGLDRDQAVELGVEWVSPWGAENRLDQSVVAAMLMGREHRGALRMNLDLVADLQTRVGPRILGHKT